VVAAVAYVDASALVKLVVPEAETQALIEYLALRPLQATSVIARVEVGRALLRAGVRADERLADVFDHVALLPVEMATAEHAARLGPTRVRALDAIHLAAALALAPDLEAIVTYDVRLADAAREQGVEVAAPGS
jgi:predicted nucleic acid-binding protein